VKQFENEEQVAEFVANEIREQAEAEIGRLVAMGVPRAWIDEHLELAPLTVEVTDTGFEYATRFRFKRPIVAVPKAPVKLSPRATLTTPDGEIEIPFEPIAGLDPDEEASPRVIEGIDVTHVALTENPSHGCTIHTRKVLEPTDTDAHGTPLGPEVTDDDQILACDECGALYVEGARVDADPAIYGLGWAEVEADGQCPVCEPGTLRARGES